jgi:O-antigen/teichoic acid export membrane protein
VSARVQRFVGAARKLPLPEGTYAIAFGFVIGGITAYVFQVLAAADLSNADYAALNVLWALVFVLSPGLFQPLEQEVSRALAHRRAIGLGGAPLVKRAALLGLVLTLAVCVAGGAASKPIVDHLFNGNSDLLLALVLAVMFYFASFTARGVLSGNGRFGRYGFMLSAEGTVRIVFSAVLFVIGIREVGLYGLALSVPPIVAVLLALRGQRALLRPGPDAPYSELSRALGWLLLGSVLAQLLSYASVLGVQLLATEAQKNSVAGFITGVFVARIPLMFFQAVQAALLPKLARLAGEGKHDDFRTGMRRLIGLVIVLCLLGTAVGTLLGPWGGRILFPSKWVLGSRDMFVLTLAASAFVLALTLAQGLIALKAYSRAALSWVAGIVAFVAVVAAGHDLFLRNELAFLAGAGLSAILMAVLLWQETRSGRGSLEALVEVVTHEPLEL